MRPANLLAGLAAAAVLHACGNPSPKVEPGSAPPVPPQLAPASEQQTRLDARLEQARRELDRDFVVFAAPGLVIDRLGSPVAAPVTVGSRPGPRTMTSDDPDVVSVGADGTLVAHRQGTTRVRSEGSGSSLTVVVRARGRIVVSRSSPSVPGEGVSR